MDNSKDIYIVNKTAKNKVVFSVTDEIRQAREEAKGYKSPEERIQELEVKVLDLEQMIEQLLNKTK